MVAVEFSAGNGARFGVAQSRISGSGSNSLPSRGGLGKACGVGVGSAAGGNR